MLTTTCATVCTNLEPSAQRVFNTISSVTRELTVRNVRSLRVFVMAHTTRAVSFTWKVPCLEVPVAKHLKGKSLAWLSPLPCVPFWPSTLAISIIRLQISWSSLWAIRIFYPLPGTKRAFAVEAAVGQRASVEEELKSGYTRRTIGIWLERQLNSKYYSFLLWPNLWLFGFF